jgi:acyl carrier protein
MDGIGREMRPTTAMKMAAKENAVMSNVPGETLKQQEIGEVIRGYIIETFLPGENPDELTDATPLITGGILDSLSTIKLVEFLEGRFQIRIQAHETMVDYLNTITDIAKLVHSKL